ncbi:uncharacterized protein LOC119371124 [Jatropha curcas]|uniref:uncharacterized protein LOC119371124 n=1 Tax=Jatropha curcas TaxID=180498 RepID=UPI001893C972|nr:uncharacterized protein LOC119371124 [Jatropha curcas]
MFCLRIVSNNRIIRIPRLKYVPALSSTCVQEVDALSSDWLPSIHSMLQPIRNLAMIKSQIPRLPELFKADRTFRGLFLSGAIQQFLEEAAWTLVFLNSREGLDAFELREKFIHELDAFAILSTFMQCIIRATVNLAFEKIVLGHFVSLSWQNLGREKWLILFLQPLKEAAQASESTNLFRESHQISDARNTIYMWLKLYVYFAETTHEFNAKEADWGFTSFVPLSKIRDPKENYLVDDTLIIEAEVTVSNIMHPSVSVEPKKPKQQSIQAPPPPPPPPPVIAKEKELPKDPSVEPKDSSQDVQTKSKNILTELSSRTTTQSSSSTDDISVSPQPDNLQQQNEALAGFFNMSLEAIQQANVFGNIEEIIRTLIPNTNDLQKKTVLEDLASRLKEFQEIIPTAKATVEAAENRKDLCLLD